MRSEENGRLRRFLPPDIAFWAVLIAICWPWATAPGQTQASLNASSGSSVADPDVPEEQWRVIGGLLRSEKFDELDKMVDAERAAKTRFPGGGWRVYNAYAFLGWPFTPSGTAVAAAGDTAAWQAHFNTLERWISARPNSITARVALAEAYTNYAWAARGTEMADLVDEKPWKLFKARLQAARDVLKRASTLSSKCPQWYATMQSIARGQGWELAEQTKLLEQASQFEPLYYYYYKNHAYALQPKWYGESGDAERFAAQMARRIGGKQGAIIYFETLTCEACDSRPDLVSWELVKQGFDAEEELYGPSKHKLNGYANLATRAENRDVAIPLFLRIGNNWDKNRWESKEYFDSARSWALGPPDNFIQAWTESAVHYRTPKELPYIKQFISDFHRSYDEAVKQCAASSKYDEGPFTVCVRVSRQGTVEKTIPWPPTSVASCLVPKLATHRFAPPPQASFWVTFNIGEIKPERMHYLGDAAPDPSK